MFQSFESVQGFRNFKSGSFEGGAVIQTHEGCVVYDENSLDRVVCHAPLHRRSLIHDCVGEARHIEQR
jgi:hypothetical protein